MIRASRLSERCRRRRASRCAARAASSPNSVLSDPADHARPADDPLVRSYNDVPYTSSPDPARHPDRLATVATLLGLDVAPVATCRVLELACGDGANLVPIASTLPAATFVGFDFAARPIARAQRMIGELGLANVRALELDLRDVPHDFGTFDYIIAHGLYSWVPANLRAHVMPLIARHLGATASRSSATTRCPAATCVASSGTC